jgi:hypothetical protein
MTHRQTSTSRAGEPVRTFVHTSPAVPAPVAIDPTNEER